MSNQTPGRNGKGSLADAVTKKAKPKAGPKATTAPAPEPDVGEPPLPWPDIIPLAETPKAMPFPLEVLPGPLGDAVREIAVAHNAPPDFSAVPLLAFAGGAIGMSRVLEIVKGHRQSALLYAGIVADPGSSKSPALGVVRQPTDAVQKEYRSAWDEAMKDYAAKKAAYDEAKAKKGKENPTPIEPTRPVLRRTVVSDTTAESLILILRDNPRGFVMVRDELSALVTGMDQYKNGKGTERQFWLSNWSSEPYYCDRKLTHGEGYQACAATFISVVGCLTPDSLATLRGDERGRKGKDDGFTDRLLLGFPEPIPVRGELWQDVSDATDEALDTVIRNLFTLEMVERTDAESGEVVGHRPRVVGLTQCGKDAWEAFTHAHAAEMNAEDFPHCLKGPWAKLRGYFGRLALILHHLRWACGDRPEGDIEGETMEAAATLVTYFKSHRRKVHHVIDRDAATEDAVKILRWVKADCGATFIQRDAHRGPMQRRTAADMDAALKILCDHGFIRRLPTIPPANGRPPSPAFEVNPAVLGG